MSTEPIRIERMLRAPKAPELPLLHGSRQDLHEGVLDTLDMSVRRPDGTVQSHDHRYVSHRVETVSLQMSTCSLTK